MIIKFKLLFFNKFCYFNLICCYILVIGTICSAQSPVITSFSPSVAKSGMTIVIKGTNLMGVSAVSFGGTPAQAFGVINDSSISAIVGIGSSGSVSITNSNGSSSLSGFIFCNAFPTVSVNADPNTALCAGAQVTLTASGADNYAWAGGVINGVPFDPIFSDTMFSSRLDVKKKNSCLGSCAYSPQGVAIGDLDGDGDKDIVVSYFSGDSIFVYRNAKSSTVANRDTFAPGVSFRSGINPFAVIIEDIDGDGKKDIIVSNSGGSSITVFRNESLPGIFNTNSLSTAVGFTTGPNPVGMATADIDGDGKKDIVVANLSNMSGSSNMPEYYISIFKNTSTIGVIAANSFAPRVDYPSGYYPRSLAVDDIDGDGKPDIVAINYDTPQFENTISVFRNNSLMGVINNSSLEAKVDFFNSGPGTIDAAIGDLDGDGKKEIAAITAYDNNVYVFRNQSSIGTINSASFSSPSVFSTGGLPLYIAMADMNNDGKKDMIITNAASNSFSYYENNVVSPGAFNSTSFIQKEFLAASNPRGLAIDDLDGDSKMDLVIANSGDTSISIFSNKGYYFPVIGTTTNGCLNTNWISLDVSTCIPISMHFISVDADRSAFGIKVNWEVAEQNSIINYSIERSLSGIDFNEVGTVEKISDIENSFSFIDKFPIEGILFYRVKSISNTGNYIYSPIVKVSDKRSTQEFAIMPNPIKSEKLNIKFQQQPSGKYDLKVINYIGQTVATYSFTHAGLNTVYSFTLPSKITSGIYYVIISHSGKNMYKSRFQKLSN